MGTSLALTYTYVFATCTQHDLTFQLCLVSYDILLRWSFRQLICFGSYLSTPRNHRTYLYRYVAVCAKLVVFITKIIKHLSMCQLVLHLHVSVCISNIMLYVVLHDIHARMSLVWQALFVWWAGLIEMMVTLMVQNQVGVKSRGTRQNR